MNDQSADPSPNLPWWSWLALALVNTLGGVLPTLFDHNRSVLGNIALVIDLIAVPVLLVAAAVELRRSRR